MTDGGGLESAAEGVIADPGFQTEAAQIRARATLTELLPEPPQYAWTYIPHRVVRNASAAFSELERVAIDAPGELDTLAGASLEAKDLNTALLLQISPLADGSSRRRWRYNRCSECWKVGFSEDQPPLSEGLRLP